MIRSLLTWLSVVGVAFLAMPSWAEDTPAKILEELRSKGEYDKVLEVVSALETDPAIPAAVRETLPYERGVTLLEGAPKQRDEAARELWLTSGVKSLETFLDQQVDSPLAPRVHQQLGTAYVEQARRAMKLAEKATGEARSKSQATARERYGRALSAFEKIEGLTTAKLASLPLVDAEARTEAQKDLLQAKLFVAATHEEQADAWELDSAGRREALEKAAGLYEKFGEKYRTRLAGLYARMYQGRCLQKLGDHAECLKIVAELLANPTEPEPFREFRLRLLEIEADSRIAVKDYEMVIIRIQPLVDGATEAGKESPRLATLREKLSVAKQALAEAK